MTYELFEKIVTNLVDTRRLAETLYSAASEYNKVHSDMMAIEFPITPESDIITLLEIILDDEGSWIDYWVNELNCGEDYTEGSVLDENESPIPLKTIQDLWNILHD